MKPGIPTYIAKCCREWIAPYGYEGGRCGLCNEKPTFLREDASQCWACGDWVNHGIGHDCIFGAAEW